jgi:hypothetical protein
MSPVLLKAGYVQIGNPYWYNYDPVCFAPQQSRQDPPLVQIDHESVLQFGKIETKREVAPSFIHLLNCLVRDDEMPGSVG